MCYALLLFLLIAVSLSLVKKIQIGSTTDEEIAAIAMGTRF
jgi:hypothetical protein